MKSSTLLAAFALALTASSVQAQESAPQTVPFEGGTFTITETPQLDKILAYDGKELARDYVAYYERTVDLNGTKVAIFDVGGGGNACGPQTVLAWKTEAGIQSTVVGEGECGTPPASATGDTLYFVPYLRPGASAPVRVWSPQEGLKVAGELSFVPQPGTSWADIVADKITYPSDFFANAELYAAAQVLLGNELEQVALGLSVAGETKKTASGILFTSGCVPHACGSSDAFIGVDVAGKKLYFAQQGDKPEPKTWPTLTAWPAEVKDAMTKALIPPQ
ncbi:hypothetical protein [Aminobacter sp. AP02]|uniref:hypothetical protein n=1 Tax=Aminobacter sp. AP02 TaxID=2135737 RepID=UPI000D6BE4B7|nr:hypothetical protein [Aminobacter sp. AP02]PWK76048.1 hypothetical protein C8K44_10233 [Aminobacter sp. AP02]